MNNLASQYMKITNAVSNDFELIFTLLLELWPDYVLDKELDKRIFDNDLKSKQKTYLVATEKDLIVGLI